MSTTAALTLPTPALASLLERIENALSQAVDILIASMRAPAPRPDAAPPREARLAASQLLRLANSLGIFRNAIPSLTARIGQVLHPQAAPAPRDAAQQSPEPPRVQRSAAALLTRIESGPLRPVPSRTRARRPVQPTEAAGRSRLFHLGTLRDRLTPAPADSLRNPREPAAPA